MAEQRDPHAGTPEDTVSWPANAMPHGYDQCEFAPEQCTRDFARSRRPREPDEERRHLRAADAAIGEASDPKSSASPATWDDDDPEVIDGSSRLYKD